ncbi:MAG TPA: DUF6265 family protein [Casimicrobiaceae bacterium]|nr:DUF6265 family protein [Casimicrobiaceae bacterium]
MNESASARARLSVGTMLCVCAGAFGALALCAAAHAQQPVAPGPAPAPQSAAPAEAATPAAATPTAAPEPSGPLAPLAWLEGCWQGNVNHREFREQWLPLRGGVLVGAGQSVLNGKMQDYQYMRIESKSEGIYFAQFSGDRKETSFRLAGTQTADKDTIFTFANTAADAFPARLVYRRGSEGWLYETIEGTLNGGERRVIYPLRRVDCETGEFILR